MIGLKHMLMDETDHCTMCCDWLMLYEAAKLVCELYCAVLIAREK